MTFKSLGRFRRRDRFSIAEVGIAFFSPILAIVLRGIDVNGRGILTPLLVYCCAAAIVGSLTLIYVNISKSPSGFVSTVDLIKTFKAALAAAVGGVIATYFATHMQYIPRYVPVIHFFLFFGLITVLNIWRARQHLPAAKSLLNSGAGPHLYENQLLLGCGPMSVHYAALIDELPDARTKIVGIVSICGDLVGSTLGNRTVLGPVGNIEEIWSEFKNHGVDIHRIVIAAADLRYQQQALDAVAPHCEAHGIKLSLLSDLIGTSTRNAYFQSSEKINSRDVEIGDMTQPVVRNPYLIQRQRYEWIIALLLVGIASPFLILIGLISYFDVGRPIIFWQQRVGKWGEMITVHKFRTLPHKGMVPNDAERAPSWIGRFLQATRLDELPQLFDIIEGRLSFIGPRPLLPHDLPAETGARESVLPGVTGWAQVHGGKSITADEKIALDDWYLRNASLWLDLFILGKTLRVALRGQEKRDNEVIARAVAEFRHGAQQNEATLTVPRKSETVDHKDHQTIDNDIISRPTAA